MTTPTRSRTPTPARAGDPRRVPCRARACALATISLCVALVAIAACNARVDDAASGGSDGAPNADDGGDALDDSPIARACSSPLDGGVPSVDDVPALCGNPQFPGLAEWTCEDEIVVDNGVDDCSDFWIFDAQTRALEAIAHECDLGKIYCTSAVPGFQLRAECLTLSAESSAKNVCSTPDAGAADAD